MQRTNIVGFCPDCGSKLDDQAKFCGKCGLSRLKMQDPLETNSGENSDPSDTYVGRFGRFDSKDEESTKHSSTVLRSHKPLLWIGAGFVLLLGIAFLGKSTSNQGSSLVSDSAISAPAVSSPSVPDQSSPSQSSPRTPKASATPKPSKTTQVTQANLSPTPAISKPKPKKIDQCAIDRQTISDLSSYENLIATIPTGSNDSSNTSRILDWVQSATALSDAVNSDSTSTGGRISSLMGDAASDLSDLAGLASDWANNNLSDPANFPTQYAAAAGKVRADYTHMTSLCGSKLPGL